MRNKFTFLVFLVISVFFGAFSCNKSEALNDAGKAEQAVSLERNNINAKVGERFVLKPAFTPEGRLHRTYYWVSDNPRVIEIVQHDDLSATIIAKRIGTAKVTLRSTDGALEVSCEIKVEKSENAAIKILTIGNGFSEDAVEHYLYDIAKQAGVKVAIGDLYLKGASLDKHYENAANNNKTYQLRLIDQFGNKSNTSDLSIEEAVVSEDWDYISFQQSVAESGLSDTYTDPLPKLVDYVKDLATNPQVKYVFHQTWAYEQSSSDAGFANYNSDQMTMFNAIVDAVYKAVDLTAIDVIVPAGTAIQNARTSIVGDQLCRDGVHLNEMGQYTAACTWFEAVFNKDVVGNKYIPAVLSDYNGEIAQHAAHAAITNPREVTTLTDYQSAGPLKSNIFVGFGAESVVDGWNAFLSNKNYTAGASIDDLLDEDNKKTGIAIEITKSFNDRNNNGVADVSTDFDIPSAVSMHSYYGNGRGVWLGKQVRESAFTISNLNKDQSFNLCFFGSRNGVGDNRETKFIVQGKNSRTVYLNVSNNSSRTVCADGIKPDENGEITVTVTMGENNNNGSGFYYISAMRFSPVR